MEAQAQDGRCERCAALLERDDLRCSICGLTTPVRQASVEVEQARVVRCQSCGAGVTYDVEAKAPKCAFCGSKTELVRQEDPIEQAQAVLPFQVGLKAAHGAMKTWLSGLGYFRPSDLASEATLESLRPIFWPAWVFNALAQVSWTADSNAGSGKSSWAPHAGQTSLDLANLVVPASRGLTVEECTHLSEGLNFSQLAPSAQGPAGTQLELFATARSGARQLVTRAIETAARESVKGQIPGTRFRKIQCAALLTGLTTQRISIPSYVLAYRYQGKLYRVLVHGQDASRVFGNAPWSLWKLTFAVAGGACLVALALWMAWTFGQR